MTNITKKKKDEDIFDISATDTTSINFDLTDSGVVWNADLGSTTGTYETTDTQLLRDIWHNQATIIKWLSKIAENTKNSR